MFLPRGRTLHFPLLNFMRFLAAHCSSLSRSLCTTEQHDPLVYSCSSQLGVIYKLAEGTLCPILQIINEDVKWDWTQY